MNQMREALNPDIGKLEAHSKHGMRSFNAEGRQGWTIPIREDTGPLLSWKVAERNSLQ